MQRMRLLGNPPLSGKESAPLRFGILGAARIGPDALITPAKSHPAVVVAAVASRDPAKAAAYATKHNIPKTYSGPDCYQQLISDPRIDVVYNALPNGLHYEWSMRAISAGKHVLVEKPIANTEAEARRMINFARERGVVLLEAIHWTFHPAAQRVKEIIDSGELGSIKSIKADFAVPSLFSSLFFLKDDVRYNYDLGGGCTMDMGVYPLSALRYFTRNEPLEVSASASLLPTDPTRIDRGMHATLAFPSSVTGELYCDFAMPGWGPLSIVPRMLKATVLITLEGGEIEFFGFPLPHIYHSIKVRPKRGKSRTERVYRHPDGGGQDWWSSYRYQLEAFVDKIRGRKPQAWPPEDEPVYQMKCVEEIYHQANLPSRPTSLFHLDY